jgi:hypothetical protein
LLNLVEVECFRSYEIIDSRRRSRFSTRFEIDEPQSMQPGEVLTCEAPLIGSSEISGPDGVLPKVSGDLGSDGLLCVGDQKGARTQDSQALLFLHENDNPKVCAIPFTVNLHGRILDEG